NARSYTLSGSSISITTGSGAGNVTVNSGNHTIASPVVLKADTTFTITPAASTLTVASVTANGKNVTKNGAGNVLVQSSMEAGAVTVSAGKLQISAAGGANHIKATSLALAGGQLDLSD